LTANAVASRSLDPPLVLVAVDKSALTLDYLKKNRCFAVNILRRDQEHISRRFARPGPKDFSDLKITTASTAAPILADCLAYVDCRVVNILPGGDHEIFIGEIVGGKYHGGEPLLYHAGGYHRLAERGDTGSDPKMALGLGMSTTKSTKDTKDTKSDRIQ
jgi:flavin reductase (DIM6/NTAB) family NADH-FMN oxidoreductase RutF